MTVFAALALSGPGRIDIVDGQTRYEVARSLVEHGDSIIRDPRVWFAVFPGRDGRNYTNYRIPQSAAGALAILAADCCGPAREGRRRFFFTLTGALAGGLLAATYAALFRYLRHSPLESLCWAAAGVLCTPIWFYGTSTFDDILGALAVVLAITCALAGRNGHPHAWAAGAGVALGLAFHCKQPLGIFVVPVLAALYHPEQGWRSQKVRLALPLTLLTVAVVLYLAYDDYKFPASSRAGQAELLKKYVPVWSKTPHVALAAMALSLGAGAFFYNPAGLVCTRGLRAWWKQQPRFCGSLAVALAVYVGFICCLTFFKGDPTWGPRYLTPAFAVLWIFAPAGCKVMRWSVVVGLLGLSLLVQVSSICVDPHRLFIERSLPSAFYLHDPELYFHPAISHLVNRPREIIEVLQDRGNPARSYTPAPTPTFAFPIIDYIDKGSVAVSKYQVLSGLRFWWASFRFLSPEERPINLVRTALLLLFVAAAGAAAQVYGLLLMRYEQSVR